MRHIIRKIMVILTVATVLPSVVILPVNAVNSDIQVFLNGQKISFDVPPMIINDFTMVPMRAIFEALGYEVEWDDANKSITAINSENTIFMKLLSNEMKYNDTTITLNVPPISIDDRTLVPVRAISETSGYNVSWDGINKTVIIEDDATASYYDATKEIEQINSFIEQGLYLEAIECCQQTLAWHKLSIYDISLLKGLKTSSEEKYENYKILSLKKILNGQWYNGEQEWATRYGFTFSNDNTVKYEGYRIYYNGTFSILNDSEVLLHFDDNKALWAGSSTETLAVIDVMCEYDHNTGTLTATLEKIYDTNEVYFEDGKFKRSTDLVYDDITTEVNQIRSYMARGLYVEAMQLCKFARELNDLTLEDKNLLTELYWDAHKKYFDYLEKEEAKNLSKVVTDYQKQVMYSTIKTYVSSRLKSAATAIWPSYSAQVYRYNENGMIIATGVLEAMNSFGGYGKVYYTFRFNDDLSVDYWYVD